MFAKFCGSEIILAGHVEQEEKIGGMENNDKQDLLFTAIHGPCPVRDKYSRT